MTTAIQFKHRLPPSDWKSSNMSIVGYVLPRVASSAILAQDLFDAIGGLSTRDPTAVETINVLIYKSKLIKDNLLDAAELLNDLDNDGGCIMSALQDRNESFSKARRHFDDARSLIQAAERDDGWDSYAISALVRAASKEMDEASTYFYEEAATEEQEGGAS